MDGLSKLVSVIEEVAPILANAIVPGGGIIVSILEQAFGVKGVDEIANVIQNDPASVIKLKALEAEHKYDLQNIISANAVNSRQREILLAQATGKRDWTPSILSILVTVMYISIIFYSMYHNYDDDKLTDRIQSLIMLVFGYYFVSSFK